ncbi:MAG: ClpXP protease specificity-enhancing factor [Aquimonas sp.]|nr:ClpXP protease specificity-enhancing factor [Aquimonas sp.]
MSDAGNPRTSSNRPYLLRAIYDWISDNGLTPYLLVDASFAGVQVPPASIKDGKVVLNIATRAVDALELGNAQVRFLARFGGVSQAIHLPLPAIEAIYAQETGQGMMLPPDDPATTAEAIEPEPESSAQAAPPRRGNHLRIIK